MPSETDRHEMIAAMRIRLLKLRADIENAAATGEGLSQVVELDQSRMGRLSRMDAMQVQAMSQASDQRRERRLQKITAALARLDQGTFGFCQSCDEAIAKKRLEFDPGATLCIDCASKAEQK